MAQLCSHLFIDEAHHLPADGWSAFRKAFQAKRIVQFTATPFRRDGKRVDGRVVFNYPLRRAQEEDYFRPITLLPVHEYDVEQQDAAVAAAAVGQLRSDVAAGLHHLAMARTNTILRAEAVHRIYLDLAPDLRPVLVHSKQGRKEIAQTLSDLRSSSPW